MKLSKNNQSWLYKKLLLSSSHGLTGQTIWWVNTTFLFLPVRGGKDTNATRRWLKKQNNNPRNIVTFVIFIPFLSRLLCATLYYTRVAVTARPPNRWGPAYQRYITPTSPPPMTGLRIRCINQLTSSVPSAVVVWQQRLPRFLPKHTLKIDGIRFKSPRTHYV